MDKTQNGFKKKNKTQLYTIWKRRTLNIKTQIEIKRTEKVILCTQ